MKKNSPPAKITWLSKVRKQREFHGVWPKVNQAEKAHNDFVHQFELNPISSLSENVQQLLHQSKARKWQEFRRAWLKVTQAKESPKWVRSPKLELNLISGFSANVQKLLNQSEARKQWEFNGVYPIVNQAKGVPYRMYLQSLRSIIWAVYPEMDPNCLTNKRAGNGWNSGTQWSVTKNKSGQGRLQWAYSPNLSWIKSAVCLKMHGNWMTNQKLAHLNKSSQWLPNTPFASISECLVS